MRLARGLLLLSAVLFAVTGLGYLVVPGLMLAVVGVESTSTSDFLIRTEGVALLCGAGLIWAVLTAGPRPIRIGLVALSAYYVVGSLVDLAAFAVGIVGLASVPSAAARIVVGCACLVAAWRLDEPAS